MAAAKKIKRSNNKERGIALFIALFALLILSAIATGMMFMADTETAVNMNYRDAQTAYFGSMAGLEEGRERLRPGSANPVTAPTGMPSSSAPTNVVYIVNPGVAPGGAIESASDIQPWNSGNRYFDDEICHENFTGLGLTNPGYNVPCTSAAAQSSVTVVNSVSPGTGSAAAMSYKWVRITLKQNGSTPPYYVNLSNSGTNLATQVCWDGVQERLINGASLQEFVPEPDRYAQRIRVVAGMPAMMWYGANGNSNGSGVPPTTGTPTTGTPTTGTPTTGTPTTGTPTTGTPTTGTPTTGTPTTGTSGGLAPGVAGAADLCQQQSGSLYAVYQVTSLAVTASGARRVTQHEIAKSILALNLPGAMTFDGPAPTYSPSSSNAFLITGNQPTTGPDACASGSNQPAVAATDPSGAAYLNTTITGTNPNRSDQYTGTSCSYSAVPCIANASATMMASTPDLTTIAGLNDLVATIDSNADQRVTGAASVANWGTASNPQIIIVRGNVTIPSGYGILVVTGTATFDGGSAWKGAVLVIGDGILLKNGGGGGDAQGGVLVANTNCSNSPNSSGVRATCTPIPVTQTTPGPPYIDWNGGGAANITYNSCALRNAGTRPLFKVISFRELTY